MAAALLATLALLAGASTASAAPAAVDQATSQCWKDVVNDWFDNNRIDRIYPIACYSQAIQHLDQYSDIANYSNASDDIHRALLAAIRQDRGNGGGSGPTTGGGSGGGGGSIGSGGGGSGGTGYTGANPPGHHQGIFQRVIDSIGPSNASSVPLPLLVLAGLAVLLFAAAGGTWLARRIQERRVTPAPATQPQARRSR